MAALLLTVCYHHIGASSRVRELGTLALGQGLKP